jgi:hypothetical protein
MSFSLRSRSRSFPAFLVFIHPEELTGALFLHNSINFGAMRTFVHYLLEVGLCHLNQHTDRCVCHWYIPDILGSLQDVVASLFDFVDLLF